MILQEKESSIWEAHQTQGPPMRLRRYAEMGGELLGYLLPIGQLDACLSHAYPKYSQRDSNQVSRFCPGLHSG